MSHFIRAIARDLSLCAAILVAGCAGGPVGTEDASGPAFYPPLPDAPRIQYLTTISSERDVGAQESGFEKFVVGEAANVQQLRQPYGVAMYQGRMYVADSRAPGLAVFDFVKKRFSLVTGTGGGRMRRPINVTIDADGTKYVTDTGRNQILVYDREEHFLSAYGVEGQFKPVDTAISGERLYVADIQHHQIHVLDKHTGATLFSFGKAGSAVGELYHPTNIAIGADGDVYVVETSNFRVQRFTADGRPVRVYGRIGNEIGTFARPKGIALDHAGRLYVGDAAFENIQVFDNDGKLLMFFGQPGGRVAGLNLPAGVTIDYDSVGVFRHFADPRFALEYVILVASQFGPNKVDVFGFGRLQGAVYPSDEKRVADRSR